MFTFLVALLMLLLGINTTVPGPVTPTPPGQITLSVGETATRDIGFTNQSSRTRPLVVTEPDPAIVSFETKMGPAPDGCNPGGCQQPTWIELTAVSPGVTSFAVQQCFTPKPKECSDPHGEPVTYFVVVEP